MLQSFLSDNNGQSVSKRLFYICSICILVVMPALSHMYGQSGDEWLQMEYGKHIWNYFFNGDKQALDYSNKNLQYQGIQYYGGLFDFYMEVLHHWFPSVGMLALRHFFNALTGAFLMIFTGLLAQRVTKKWSIGLLALLFILFSPRIFGESMNNPKDIPFACGFTASVYFFLCLLQDLPARLWRNIVGIAISFALTFGVRPAGGLLLAANYVVIGLLYFFLNKDFKQQLLDNKARLLKKTLLLLAAAFVVGYTIGLFAWPWGLQDPIGRPLESLRQMTNIVINLRVLFEGTMHMNTHMPWYYEFKWIIISNPVIVIAGTALFLLLILAVRKKYGMFTVLFLLFAAFFTPLYMIYKKSSVHDTWRHLFFIYPYWVVMAAVSIDVVTGYIRNPRLRIVPYAVALLGLLPAVLWTFRSHPNQYVYFNELEGGVKGAFGYYDIDYYQNGGLQAANWILKNAQPSAPGKKIIVKSNLSAIDKYFERDTARFEASYGRYGERSNIDWDYFITYSRFVAPEVLQNNLWPPSNTIYSVSADGVPLVVVLQRKSKESIEAYEAIQHNNFPLAIEKYRSFLQKDQSDDMPFYYYSIALANTNQVDAAIDAAKKALEMDPSGIEYLQLLAKLYQAKGDQQNANNMINRANALIMELENNAE